MNNYHSDFPEKIHVLTQLANYFCKLLLVYLITYSNMKTGWYDILMSPSAKEFDIVALCTVTWKPPNLFYAGTINALNSSGRRMLILLSIARQMLLKRSQNRASATERHVAAYLG